MAELAALGAADEEEARAGKATVKHGAGASNPVGGCTASRWAWATAASGMIPAAACWETIGPE